MIGLKKYYQVLFVFLVILVTGMLIIGCQSQSSKQSSKDQITAAVSIVPQKTFVKAVAKDLVEVITMIPPGYSPGNYEPPPDKMEKFSDSQIYFSIGVPADQTYILPRAHKLNRDLKIVKLHKRVANVYPDREFVPGKRDPHIWMSPKRVKRIIEIIKKQLIAIDSTHQEVYKQNAASYINKLDQLDQYIRSVFNHDSNKTFIIYHPSLGYLTKDYGLKMIAVQKSGKKASAKQFQQVIKKARANNIKAVFYQKQIDSGQTEALAEEIGAKTIAINPLASNYIENMKKIIHLLNKY